MGAQAHCPSAVASVPQPPLQAPTGGPGNCEKRTKAMKARTFSTFGRQRPEHRSLSQKAEKQENIAGLAYEIKNTSEMPKPFPDRRSAQALISRTCIGWPGPPGTPGAWPPALCHKLQALSTPSLMFKTASAWQASPSAHRSSRPALWPHGPVRPSLAELLALSGPETYDRLGPSVPSSATGSSCLDY